MTEKELHRLSRQDFLQLLLMQGTEMQQLNETLEASEQELALLRQGNERLKTRLDEKDALIEHLKRRLDAKDETIRALRAELESRQASRRIELDEAGSIAMAALKLNGVFEAAQKAADQYLYNLKLLEKQYGPRPPVQPQRPADVALPSAAPEAADTELEQLLRTDRERSEADHALAEQEAAALSALKSERPAAPAQPPQGEKDIPTANEPKKSSRFTRLFGK